MDNTDGQAQMSMDIDTEVSIKNLVTNHMVQTDMQMVVMQINTLHETNMMSDNKNT